MITHVESVFISDVGNSFSPWVQFYHPRQKRNTTLPCMTYNSYLARPASYRRLLRALLEAAS